MNHNINSKIFCEKMNHQMFIEFIMITKQFLYNLKVYNITSNEIKQNRS